MNRAKPKSKPTSLQEEDSQPYYHPILEQQMIIRFPADIAARLTASMEDEHFEDFKIKFVDKRHATVKVFGETLNAVLVSLPTMVETHRTVDGSHLFKSADISEILIVHRPNAAPKGITEEFVSEHGLTPPTFNIVSKRLARQAAVKDGQADSESLEGIEYWEMVEIQLSALLSKDRTAKPICRQQFLEEPDVDAVTLEKALRRAGFSQFKGYSGQEIDESELMSTENEPNVRVPPELLAQVAPEQHEEEDVGDDFMPPRPQSSTPEPASSAGEESAEEGNEDEEEEEEEEEDELLVAIRQKEKELEMANVNIVEARNNIAREQENQYLRDKYMAQVERMMERKRVIERQLEDLRRQRDDRDGTV